MARKKKHAEHENHERWLVSYADLLTLLFALFVVLYAFATAKQSESKQLIQGLKIGRASCRERVCLYV